MNNGHRGEKNSHSSPVKALKMILSKQPSDFPLVTTSHRQLDSKHTLESVHKQLSSYLQMCNCLPKSFPLLHIIPCFFKHELTASQSHISN